MQKNILLLSLLVASVTAYGGNSPTIQVNTLTTHWVDLSAHSASGVINDPTDPLRLYGIDFIITDEDAASVVLTCSSNNATVVPDSPSSLIVTGRGNSRNVKISPAGPGYATITMKVRDNENKTASYTLKYAASDAASNPEDYTFHTLYSSASTAIPFEDDYMFVGDDELNEIGLFYRHQSGTPLTRSEISSYLDLPEPGDPEIDIEASCISPSRPERIYWMGSLSNSNSGNRKPNRDRIFATIITGSGPGATLIVDGYAALRDEIVAWGDTYGYNFSASAADGKSPKSIDGFSVEGLEFAPDNTTLYIGFRAPYVPVSDRTKAVICPLLNFEAWFNNGSPSGRPAFGEPIELDLGGRGIRSLGKNSMNEYLLIAGAYDGTENFSLFMWTGHPDDRPVLLPTPLDGLNPEGIAEVPPVLKEGTSIELINDDGSMDWYGDDKESKSLGTIEFQKFASTRISLSGTLTSVYDKGGNTDEQVKIQPFPNPVTDILRLSLFAEESGPEVINIYNSSGILMTSVNHILCRGENRITIDCSQLPPGIYLFNITTGKPVVGRFVKK